MITIEKMNAYGANTAEGISRCAGMEALYLKLAAMLPAEKNFDLLKDALEKNDLDAGFAAAHALKGVLGNLSVTPMYNIVAEMTELLRSRTETDYQPMLTRLLQLRDELAALCA